MKPSTFKRQVNVLNPGKLKKKLWLFLICLLDRKAFQACIPPYAAGLHGDLHSIGDPWT